MTQIDEQQQTIHALSRAIAKIPEDSNPKNHINRTFYQGVMALLQEQLELAEQAFHAVLALDKTHTDARTNLGVIALKKEQNQQAITYFSEALGFDETHENARNNLAATFIHHNRFENALTHYNILLENHPDNIEYGYNAGVAEMALGHLDKAQTHFKSVLKKNAIHSASLTNLASIASRLNQTSDAIHYLKRAKAANPQDTSSTFMLDALTEAAPMREASHEYAKNLFDNYALHYEKHMSDTLNYCVPKHIAQYLHHFIPNSTLTTNEHPLHVKRTLDIGCGTGLSGIVLRELSLHLTGVDLSPKMLAEAEQKAIYDELFEADLIPFLAQKTQPFSLIVAADVLPYLGELDTLFKHVKKALSPSGLFILTTEVSKSTDWLLQKTARFAHHPDYIQTLAKQYAFDILQQKTLIARKHHDKDLPIILYALQSA
ncbi:MAG: tetratricopeptide repeat protein [Gammaproteobacteria bacterium]|nr:tetratricopeptide repeat protein [Gammaproteobacteria bacterium]